MLHSYCCQGSRHWPYSVSVLTTSLHANPNCELLTPVSYCLVLCLTIEAHFAHLLGRPDDRELTIIFLPQQILNTDSK